MTLARHLLRHLRRSALVVAIMALGIGLDGALFSVVTTLERRPAPGIPASPDLVRIRGLRWNEAANQYWSRSLVRDEVDAMSRERDALTAVAAWVDEDVLLGLPEGDTPLLAAGTWVTPEYFQVLGVAASVGRARPAIADGRVEAVISHELWTSVFGADPAITGRAIDVRGLSATVVGVAGEKFRGANERDRAHVVWLPLDAFAMAGGRPDSTGYEMAGRLKRDLSLAQATALADRVARAIAGETGSRIRRMSAEVVPLLAFNDVSRTGSRSLLLAVTSLALAILVVTGSNAGVLLAGAGVRRRREVVVRLALGASRARLIGMLLLESLVCALAAGLVAFAALAFFRAMASSRLVDLLVVLDWPTVAVGLGLVVAMAVLAGVSPALHATRESLADALRGVGAPIATRQAVQRRLVVLQVAITQPLLVGLAVFFVLVVRDRTTGLTPDGERLVVVELDRVGTRLTEEQVRSRLAAFSAHLSTVPGVERVIATPGGFGGLTLEGGTNDETRRVVRVEAAPGYLALHGIPLIRGREFAAGERDAIIIDTSLARASWGLQDPIGRRYRAGGRELTVVGVVAEARAPGVRVAGGTLVYTSVPPDREAGIFPTIRVRTSGPAAALIPAITIDTRRFLPELRIGSVATVNDLERTIRRERLNVSSIAGVAGALALILAAIGLYATVALTVEQRLREIGIRVALGSGGRRIQAMFLKDALRLVVTGLALGLPLTFIAMRAFAAPVDVPTAPLGVAIGTLVVGVTALATWVPARRATRVDPVETLRGD